MRIFKDIHLVEQLGSGMIRILKKYNRSIFTITPNFIRVTFPFVNRIDNSKLNEGLKSLFNVKQDNPGIKAIIDYIIFGGYYEEGTIHLIYCHNFCL